MSVARLFADHRAHNAAVPSDRQDDACRCPLCGGGFTSTVSFASGAAPVAGDPAAAASPPLDGQRPEIVFATFNPSAPMPPLWPRGRGPVQDESRFRDPDDVQLHLDGDAVPLIDDVGGGP